MKDGTYRVLHDEAGPVVRVPLVGAAWMDRGRVYWRRRIAFTVLALVLWLISVLWAALVIRGLSRSGTGGAEVGAVCYASLMLPGAWLAVRWLRRVPAVGRGEGGRLGSFGLLLFLAMPLVVGAGLVVLPALLRRRLPGELRAREITAHLRNVRS